MTSSLVGSEMCIRDRQKYMAKDKSAGGRREKPAEVSLIK